MIQLTNVQFIRNERHILQNIQLHMREGEHWVILGRNGSGKTTILEMINGYEFPSSGQVQVLGNRYGECDVREVRKEIGYISQSLLEKMAFRDPVSEIVATGEYAFLRFYNEIESSVMEKALAMLEKVKLLHLRDQPLGTLSQGERKKVMLARSLMMNPRLLIMDEPCAGLDLYEREQLLLDIQELGKQTQIIYVTHHIEELIPLFTHVAILKDGQIIAAGNKEEVLTAETLFEAFSVHLTIDWEHGRPWVKTKTL